MMSGSAPSTTDPVVWLGSVMATDPERAMLRMPDGRMFSYRDAAEISGRLAAAMSLRGVTAGARVVVQVEKSPEAFLLYLACLRLGAVLVPLNAAYTLAELEYFIDDAQPRLVIVRPSDRDTIGELARSLGVAHVDTLGTAADGSLMEAAASVSAHAFAPFDGKPDSVAALLYTSGTTGRSKGAMITRRNLAANAAALVDAWRFSERDVLLHALPIFHAHGIFIAANTALAAGASMVFLPKFDSDEVLRLLPQATVMMGVPTFYTRLLQDARLSKECASHLRLFVSGSAPLLAQTHAEFAARTGHAILERYAMTETLVITSNPYEGERRPGAVGFPLPGVEVRISELETGKVLDAVNAVGMIEVRGTNVCQGYWRNPEKTKADLRADGFFITGDLGQFDADGYLTIVGRSKDLIITGGYNVYPKEVEAEIDALSGVAESAVIGVPHRDLGEGVTAVVIRSAGSRIDEAQILAQLHGRLASYKIPKHALFVDALPRNALGKVQKNILRKTYEDLYR